LQFRKPRNEEEKMEITLKGKTFTSNLTDQAAMEIVSKLSSDFAQSLTRQWVIRGKLSPAQWPWVHKLAVDTLSPPAPVVAGPSCLSIVTLFSVASANGMKRPRISFPQAKFSLAGKLSRHAGCIQVSQGAYPGKYFGRIEATGQFVPGRDAALLDMEFLSAFAADPIAFAQSNGKESGSCRFCNLTLTTPESVSVGYGPICAGHWGLPWGK
jgi:hypothetical protein